jgi:hypothetical protein
MPSLNQIVQVFNLPPSITILTDRQVIARAQKLKQNSEDFSLPTQSGQIDSPLDYTSSLGTLVFSNIEFLPGTYETNTKGVFKSFGSSTNGPDRLRYEQVLITVSQQKLIVKTQIQGRNGSVKEYIGLDDYQVQVNGIITGNNGHMPIDEISALQKMCIAPIPIEVASTYLQLFGIDYLVLDSFEFPESEGGYSYQKFTLSFFSDTQQELELINL